MNKKKPRRKDNPKKKQNPISPPITSTQNKKLVWIVSRIDDSSKWGWHKITCPDFLRKIWEKMRYFETMRWVDILGASHHAIPISNIIRPAQKRLEELGHDDKETLVSFHITGKERIGLFGQEKEPFYCGGILIMKFTLHLKSTPKNYRSRHREFALRLKIICIWH